MPRRTSSLLYWHEDQQVYKLIHLDALEVAEIIPDSPEWFAWLQEKLSFTFHARSGAHYTVRRESMHHYWYAYWRMGKKIFKRYLGRTEGLNLTHLEEIAQANRDL